jgi:stage II sporulation protein M
VIIESIIMIQPNIRHVLWYIILGLVVVTILLVRTGARMFNREELLGRMVDNVNLGRMFSIIWEQITGITREQRLAAKEGKEKLPRLNPLRWYRHSVFPTLKTLRIPAAVISAASLMSFIIVFSILITIPMDLSEAATSDQEILEGMEDYFDGTNPIQNSWWVVERNVRVLFVVTFMALFSFGAMSIVPAVLTFGVLGGLMAIIIRADVNVLIVIFGILPHGIFEIPALFISCAAALRAGAVVTKRPDKITVFEAWLRGIGDCIKLGIAIVIPLLLIAGFVEATITPEVVKWMLRW